MIKQQKIIIAGSKASVINCPIIGGQIMDPIMSDPIQNVQHDEFHVCDYKCSLPCEKKRIELLYNNEQKEHEYKKQIPKVKQHVINVMINGQPPKHVYNGNVGSMSFGGGKMTINGKIVN
jgi:hypothetical protein